MIQGATGSDYTIESVTAENAAWVYKRTGMTDIIITQRLQSGSGTDSGAGSGSDTGSGNGGSIGIVASSMPKTGDNASLLLHAAMMLLGCAGAAALRRRKATH